MSYAAAGAGSVEDLSDLDPDRPFVAVHDEVPVVVVRHLKDDRADVEKAAVVLVLSAAAIGPVGVAVHEGHPRSRATQTHLEDGAAGAGPEIPVEVLHSLFVADLRIWRYASARRAEPDLMRAFSGLGASA